MVARQQEAMELSTVPNTERELFTDYSAEVYWGLALNATWEGLQNGFGNNTSVDNSTSLNPTKGSATSVYAIAITALYSVVCVVGLVGNFLVMYVIVR